MKYSPNIVLAYFSECELPAPVTELAFAASVVYTDKGGRERARGWRFDFAWLQHRLALEVEGGIWIGGGHNRGRGFSKDILKYNTATQLGWRILRCVPKNLCTNDTVELVKSCLKL